MTQPPKPPVRPLLHHLHQRVQIVGGPDDGRIGTIISLYRLPTVTAAGIWKVQMTSEDIRLLADDWLEPAAPKKGGGDVRTTP